jgi:hypothetical protein
MNAIRATGIPQMPKQAWDSCRFCTHPLRSGSTLPAPDQCNFCTNRKPSQGFAFAIFALNPKFPGIHDHVRVRLRPHC